VSVRTATRTSQGKASAISLSATGVGRPHLVAAPALPQSQRSVAAGVEVLERVLATSTSDYYGCGIAGCTSGILINSEQGLVLAGLHGEHPRLVTKGGYDHAPTIAPDGHLIAYLSRRHPSWSSPGLNLAVDDIVLMTSTGRQVAVFVEPGKDETIDNLSWSADSRSLAYTITGYGGPTRIVIRSIRSRHARLLTLAFGLRELAWSPDGASFVGVGALPVPPGHTPGGEDLWIVSARTGKERRLTHFANGPFPLGGFCAMTGLQMQALGEPRWSPDSKQIAFISTYAYGAVLGMEYDVRVVNVRTATSRTVFHPAAMPCLHEGVRYVVGSYQHVDVLGWT